MGYILVNYWDHGKQLCRKLPHPPHLRAHDGQVSCRVLPVILLFYVSSSNMQTCEKGEDNKNPRNRFYQMTPLLEVCLWLDQSDTTVCGYSFISGANNWCSIFYKLHSHCNLHNYIMTLQTISKSLETLEMFHVHFCYSERTSPHRCAGSGVAAPADWADPAVLSSSETDAASDLRSEARTSNFSKKSMIISVSFWISSYLTWERVQGKVFIR